MSSGSITDFKVIKQRYIWDLIKFKVIKFDKVIVKFIETEGFNLTEVLKLNVDSHNG